VTFPKRLKTLRRRKKTKNTKDDSIVETVTNPFGRPAQVPLALVRDDDVYTQQQLPSQQQQHEPKKI
jgi:hypothetical protein